MMDGSPTLDLSGHLATLTLRRPALRNSLNDDDLNTLLAHFEAINANPDVHVVVLRADTQGQKSPVFSAGYHVGGFDNDPMAPLFFEKIPDALERLRPVTVCALNGSVYGGATDVVLACDLRIGLQGIEWRMPATALGLHYYPSGLQRYVSRFGVAGAKRAFLTARPFSAEQLHAMGLFEALVTDADWASTLQVLVSDILALAPLAVQETKKSINEIAAGQMDTERLRAREHMTSDSVDFAEGRAAFAERRKPVFVGR